MHFAVLVWHDALNTTVHAVTLTAAVLFRISVGGWRCAGDRREETDQTLVLPQMQILIINLLLYISWLPASDSSFLHNVYIAWIYSGDSQVMTWLNTGNADTHLQQKTSAFSTCRLMISVLQTTFLWYRFSSAPDQYWFWKGSWWVIARAKREIPFRTLRRVMNLS